MYFIPYLAGLIFRIYVIEVTHKSRPKFPLGVVYIEVNRANFKNALCYSVNEQPLFDIAIIFAANINYDVSAKRAVLFFNSNVERVLKNADQYIRPLQDRGIKVLLSILGNHQGAGVCNFPTQTAARDFAEQLNAAVDRYKLDGIDFDDEYSKYGRNGTGQPNPYSFVYLLRELRQLMPEKIISFYYYGPATKRLEWSGIFASSFLDYSWNSIYGTFYPPKIWGLNRKHIGAAAVWINRTSALTARNLANRTINGGHGVFLFYDLQNNNANNYLSNISSTLYGTKSTVNEKCLRF